MKKLLIPTIIILLLNGCFSIKKTTEQNEFQDRVDAVFKYPYSSLHYEGLGKDLLENKYTNPLTELANRCFKSDLKVSVTYFSNATTYRIDSSQDEIDQCIIKMAKEPMDDHAISILSRSDLYEKYKNSPHFRNSMNLYKADGVITIKEYMDIVKALNESKEAESEADNKKNITEL